MSDLQELMVGSTRVVALKDGELTLPKEILLNIDEDTAKKLSDENNQLTNSQINAYLVFKDEKILLVDSGCRDLFGPTCGFVHEEIAKANVKPEDITDIFFTHLHPDHVGGSINKDGKAIFPNATVNIIEDELNFWSKDDFEDVEVNGKNMADLNKSVIEAYGERVKTIKTNHEIISGVFPVPLPGHTPGHAGFRVDDGNHSLFHMGDIIHVQNLQLKDPKICTLFDVDSESALNSRKYALDMASSDNLLCTSGHMLEPKFIHLEKRGSSYFMTS